MAVPADARAPAASGRPLLRLLGVSLVVAVGVALLCGLGAWQLQRKAWKAAMVRRIAALQSAPPEPLAAVLRRAADPAAPRDGPVKPGDFTRVQARCAGLSTRSLHLYGIRDDAPGWRQIGACRLSPGLPYASVLVDYGFEHTPPGSAPALQAVTLPREGAVLTGVLRAPDPPGWTDRLVAPPPPADPDGQWMRRSLVPMAQALGAPLPAPFMLELEAPAAGPGLVPAPLPAGAALERVGEYALTWFGLALALLGVWAAVVWRTLRRPPAAA